VEILVVIAIIAVLAAFLFPMLSRMQETGNSAKCVANLRQLGSRFAAYLPENRYEIPYYSVGGGADYTWINYVDASVSGVPPSAKVSVCPSCSPKSYKTKYTTYGIDTSFATPGPCRHPVPGGTPLFGFVLRHNPLKVNRLSQRILLADSISVESGWTKNQQIAYAKIASAPAGNDVGYVHFRHSGRANFLFYDGSVRAMTAPDLKTLLSEEYGYNGPIKYGDQKSQIITQ
jgi:prepilin-type processing-associated H-X9-DG protein